MILKIIINAIYLFVILKKQEREKKRECNFLHEETKRLGQRSMCNSQVPHCRNQYQSDITRYMKVSLMSIFLFVVYKFYETS